VKRHLLLLLAACAAALAQTGVVDTIGGTKFDNQNSGPALQWIVSDPANGIHATWTFSAQALGSGWPDRTMKYNYFDRATGQWNWIEPGDFMLSGTNSQNRRVGYGTMDVDPADCAAVVAAHYSLGGMPPQWVPVVARDVAPGAGIFDWCVGDPNVVGFFLPVVAVSPGSIVHLFIIQFAVSDNMFYTRGTSWCDWENPQGWGQSGAFGHNICASHATQTVVATWLSGADAERVLRVRVSTDAGANWPAPVDLVPPSAFSGDTGTVCGQGANILFDRNDDWLLATVLTPVIADTARTNPAELWVYKSAGNSWHRVHRAGSHSLAGSLGSNATICGRPSLGQNPSTGRFWMTWEEFDSLDVEPSTNRLRAELWYAWSDDGEAWSDPTRLTTPDGTSKRFPVLARDCSNDSLAVFFLQDVIAGFNSDSVGAASENPVCVWRGSPVGITEPDRPSVATRTTAPGIVRAGLPVIPAGQWRLFAPDGRLLRQGSAGRVATADLKAGVYWLDQGDSRRRLVVVR
jgi:hypothetical protein